jgi:hypothetical protein
MSLPCGPDDDTDETNKMKILSLLLREAQKKSTNN